MVVPIATVKYDEVSPVSVRRMKRILEQQGQIEPLQVWLDEATGLWTTFKQDPWGAEIVEAAKQLGWQTLLVVEMKRYE
jgi:hypothetical protein